MKKFSFRRAALALLVTTSSVGSADACRDLLARTPFDHARVLTELKTAARRLSPAQRAGLCVEMVSALVTRRVAHFDGPGTLEVVKTYCAGQKRALRRAVSSALAVVDELPPLAYADVVDFNGEPSREPRAVEVRALLREVLRDELLDGRDWRLVLEAAPAAHVLPLMDALAKPARAFGRGRPAQTWLAGLAFPEAERVAIGARLVAAGVPFAAVRRFADLEAPRAWAGVAGGFPPLPWLEYALWAGLEPAKIAPELERRAPMFTRAGPPRGELRAPILRLIADQTIDLAHAARAVAALKDVWPAWYGTLPILPPVESIDRPKYSAARLEMFYGFGDPRALRAESRVAAARFRDEADDVRRRATTPQLLRAELERPFRDIDLHVDDEPVVYRVVRKLLARALPRTTTPAGWIHLAETEVPKSFEQSQRVFVLARLDDLLRTADPRLEFLDQPLFTRAYLKDNSTLAALRAMRDEVPVAARTEVELNRRAIARALDVDRTIVEQKNIFHDDRGRVHRAVLANARRPFVEYLRGRCRAGARPRVAAEHVAKFRAIVREAGYHLDLVHVDSTMGAYVNVR